jgi:hypothetical protein
MFVILKLLPVLHAERAFGEATVLARSNILKLLPPDFVEVRMSDLGVEFGPCFVVVKVIFEHIFPLRIVHHLHPPSSGIISRVFRRV